MIKSLDVLYSIKTHLHAALIILYCCINLHYYERLLYIAANSQSLIKIEDDNLQSLVSPSFSVFIGRLLSEMSKMKCDHASNLCPNLQLTAIAIIFN